MNHLNLGFAGFRHDHIFSLYNLAKEKKNVEIVGCFEKNAEGIEKAKSNQIYINFNSYEELLADNSIDAIAIGDYYGVRGSMIIKALKAGKHVIADKPLCTSIEELEIIRSLSKEKNLSVCLMLDLRDNSNVCAALEIVKSGVIGVVSNIRFNGQHPLNYGVRPSWYFEEGCHGGVINDIAIHGIDLVRLFTGSDVKKVLAARCWNFFADKEPNFFDSAQFMLETDSGAGIIADVSYALPNGHGFNLPTYWEFEICGKNGIARFGYNSDGVDVYIAGENSVRRYRPISCKKDYLDCFIDDITNDRIYTKEFLKSTEQTLLIQKFADMQD